MVFLFSSCLTGCSGIVCKRSDREKIGTKWWMHVILKWFLLDFFFSMVVILVCAGILAYGASLVLEKVEDFHTCPKKFGIVLIYAEKQILRTLIMGTLCTWMRYGLCHDLWILQRSLYRVSWWECARLRESVPYVKVHRYNPKHQYPKSNGYGDNGKRSLKVWQLLHTYWLPNTY